MVVGGQSVELKPGIGTGKLGDIFDRGGGERAGNIGNPCLAGCASEHPRGAGPDDAVDSHRRDADRRCATDAEQLNLGANGTRFAVAGHQLHRIERQSIAPRVQVVTRSALEKIEGKARDTAAGAALDVIQRGQTLTQASLGARSAAGTPGLCAR